MNTKMNVFRANLHQIKFIHITVHVYFELAKYFLKCLHTDNVDITSPICFFRAHQLQLKIEMKIAVPTKRDIRS